MRRALSTTLAITMSLVFAFPVTAEPLKGTISIDRQLPAGESEALVPMSPASDQWQLEPRPPSWMRARVYTNDSLKGYYFATNALLPIPMPASMPEYGTSDVRLLPSVLASWWGYKPPQPCMVQVVRYGPRGNYKFWHSDPNGPAGYVQYNGRNMMGFVKIRYWFIDKNQEPGREFVRGNSYAEAAQDRVRSYQDSLKKQQQEQDRRYQEQVRQYQELCRQVAEQGR